MIPILLNSESTTYQSDVNANIRTSHIQNLTAYLPTIQNDLDKSFTSGSLNDKTNNSSIFWELLSSNIPSSVVENDATLFSSITPKLSEFYSDKNMVETYAEPLANRLNIFSEYEERIKNTGVGISNLWALSPIVLQDKFFTSDNKKHTSRKTIPKFDLNTVLSKVSQKFDISNMSELKIFVSMSVILEIPNLPKRLDKVIDCVNSFIRKLDPAGKSKIDVFHDDEIKDLQSISIEYFVKNATSDQCIQWTEDLVSEIIKIDEDMLNVIQVEVIPDDNY